MDELDRLNLQDGEWQALSNNHSRLAHAQALLEGATQALTTLDNDEMSVRALLNRTVLQLQRLQQHDARLQDIIASLDSALIGTDEAISDLNSYLSDFDVDPDALAQAEQRMSAIFDTAQAARRTRRAARLQAQLRDQLDALDQASDTEALARQTDEASANNALAKQLTQARKATASAWPSKLPTPCRPWPWRADALTLR